jgi:3-phenylpropionate/cinnamic acid dioxygenase small subunit
MSRPAQPNDAGQNAGALPTDDRAMALWFECYQFLVHEAQCLDDNRIKDWLALLSPQITYEVPIRVTKRRGEDPISPDGWHMKEDFSSLKMRVARLGTKSAWGEDPPSRTRRLVGNLRCIAADATCIEVRSNVLVYYGRGDASEHTVLAAERSDHLLRTGDGLRLAKRVVLLSHTTLPIQSIGIFL